LLEHRPRNIPLVYGTDTSDSWQTSYGIRFDSFWVTYQCQQSPWSDSLHVPSSVPLHRPRKTLSNLSQRHLLGIIPSFEVIAISLAYTFHIPILGFRNMSSLLVAANTMNGISSCNQHPCPRNCRYSLSHCL